VRAPLVALLFFPFVLSCKKDPGFERPAVDRGDGALPELAVPRVDRGAVVVDGHLDEAAWTRAAASEMFVDPGAGHPAPSSKVNAYVRVARDAERLYFGFVVHDRDPSSPLSRDQVDPHVWAVSSGVEIMLQPGDPGDNRDYYEIQVDVAGAVWDTRFDDYNRPVSGGPDDDHKRFGHQEWSSGVERAVSVDRKAGKYQIEIGLPWSALRSPRSVAPPNPGDVWRANFYSFRDGQAQSLAWSPILGQGNFHRSSRFGRLRFLP
jgi:Carbohydrate family 9 binding domain-like